MHKRGIVLRKRKRKNVTLNELVQKYNVTPKRTFAVDEIGMQGSLGQLKRVMGAKKMGPQYQQRDRDWENITVLITICADGGSTPPAVIFKGNAYQVKWQQDNPVNTLWVPWSVIIQWGSHIL
jgi:hypothetical protein